MNRDMVSRFGDSTPKRGQAATSARIMSINESIVEDAALEWFILRRGCGGQVGGLGLAVKMVCACWF
jgi:hypothetical protein